MIRWDWTTSIEEVMDSLHILVEQGKVLYLGISDTPAWIVSAANEYAKSHGKTQFSIYQVCYQVVARHRCLLRSGSLEHYVARL